MQVLMIQVMHWSKFYHIPAEDIDFSNFTDDEKRFYTKLRQDSIELSERNLENLGSLSETAKRSDFISYLERRLENLVLNPPASL